MSVRESNVSPVEMVDETYDCDECGSEMKWGENGVGVELACWPPLYPHRCENGHTVNLPASYPRTVTRRVANAEAPLAQP